MRWHPGPKVTGDDLLPPSKSRLIALLPLALLPCGLAWLPCKLGGKEGTKDVEKLLASDKLIRGRDVDKLLRGCFARERAISDTCGLQDALADIAAITSEGLAFIATPSL
jgi:hypothetical protein